MSEFESLPRGKQSIVDADGDVVDIIDVNGNKGFVSVSPGHVSTDNSTASVLDVDEVFTGEWEDITNFGILVVTLKASHASATDGLAVEFSSDGVNVDNFDNFTIPADTGKTFSFQASTKYYRVVYTNGGTLQTSFRLQTILKPYYIKPSSHRIQDNIVDEDDAELVKAVVTGKNPVGNFVNFQSTTAGNFKMSLEELESGVSSNSNSQLNVTQFDSSGNEIPSKLNADFTDDLDGEYGLVTSSIMYGRVDNDTISPIKVDGSTQDIQIVEHEHAEVHSGDTYFVRDVEDLAINNVLDVQITTPNTTKWGHFVFRFQVESETEWWLYENVAINTAGTAKTEFNNDRNSGNTAAISVAKITNTSIANANSDTAIAGATELMHCIADAGRDAGAQTHDREIILKQNEDYSLRFSATAAGYVCWELDWYEHTNKN